LDDPAGLAAATMTSREQGAIAADFPPKSFRVPADGLQHLLPVDSGGSLETLLHHPLRIGEQLGAATANQPTKRQW
jgi:hypothetical protein